MKSRRFLAIRGEISPRLTGNLRIRAELPSGGCRGRHVLLHRCHARSPTHLVTPETLAILRRAVELVRADHPFEIDAIVVLPEHSHAIWTLPDGDSDYAMRWRLIKARFTRKYLAAEGQNGGIASRPT